jgi:chorismate mutase
MNDLDIMNIRNIIKGMARPIVRGFAERAQYKINNKIYIPNAVYIEGHRDISYLDFTIKSLERHFANLGRYKFPDQHPLICQEIDGPVKRSTPESLIDKVPINIKEDIVNFYINSLGLLCAPGDEPFDYGKIADCDARILTDINERINLGRFVAESKLRNNYDKIFNAIGNETELVKELRNSKVEKERIKEAMDFAIQIGESNPRFIEFIEKYFGWIIDETVKVEIGYLNEKKKNILAISTSAH